MADNRYLHAVAVPERALERPTGAQSRRVASQGALSSDVPAVESVSPDAASQQFRGVLAGPGAALTAAEFEELFGASGIGVVPFFGDIADPQRDGYYATEDVSPSRPAPGQSNLQQFDGRLTRRGTRRSHRRALRTNPTAVDNPFGTGATAEVGIPARADAVEWFDAGGSQQTTAATRQRTVTGQHDDVAIYDAAEPSFETPALVYDVDYKYEWPVDVRLWDDYGRRRRVAVGSGSQVGASGSVIGTATIGSATTGDSADEDVVAWQRVYRTDHDAVGSLRLENDLLQVTLDEADGELRAAAWDDVDRRYDRLQLDPNSDWRFQRGDIRYVGVEAVDAQLTFSDGADTHRLNASLKRGREAVLFANPANAGAVPSGLVDRLAPIAATSEQDPAATADIVAKEDLGD